MRDSDLVVLIFFFLTVYADANCRRTFNCGRNRLEFPLSDKAGCGLLTVNCSDNLNPRVQLEAGGQWCVVFPQSAYYDSSSKTYAIEVRDHQLEDLKSGRDCSRFRNISLLKTQSWVSSVEIASVTTNFLSCKQSLYPYSTRVCEHYLYHRDAYSVIPESCEVLSLPTLPVPNPNPEDLLQMVTPVYRVKWAFSDGCAECLDRWQMCEVDNEGQSTCLEFEEKGSKKKIAQIVAPVVCGCAILLGLCSFLVYRHKKRINGAHLLSRDLSFDPSSKPDVEGGKSLLGVPVFPYAELEQATKNFDPSKELGDGGFGTVYYGKLSDGREVAIKRLYEHNYRRVEQFLNEINILTGLRHPNLVTLYGCTSRRSQELLLVYEYIPNGTIADHLHGQRANKAHLSWPIRMKIAIETASALLYLHKKDIIHRDVKTHNILLDNNFGVKVADFGLSRLFPTDVTHISTAPQGTPGYVDPEYHQCYQLTDKSDVYSFGVVLIELISTLPAVDITRHRHEINLANLALNRIQRCAFEELIDMSLGYKFDAEVERMTTSVAELAFRCLQHDKDLRPSMEEVFVMLTDIQAGDDSSSEMSKDGISNLTEPGKRSASPTTDDLVRLKTSNLQSA